MKILVTGANGYLGQGIVTELLDHGNEVIAADFTTSEIDSRAKCFDCNLFKIKKPYEYFEKPDAVLHLAWRDGFIHNASSHIEDLPLHYLFLKEMAESGISKLCVMGTMHEVGFFEGSIKEDTVCNPLNLYGIAKDALRNASKLLAESNNIIFQWLRGFYIVGNSQYGSSIFSKITAAERAGNTEFPFTTGQHQYDFLDYSIFCKQVAATVSQNKVVGIINICSGRPEKISDRVERFISENKYNIKLNYGVFPERKYDSLAVWGDNKKIEAILNDGI